MVFTNEIFCDIIETTGDAKNPKTGFIDFLSTGRERQNAVPDQYSKKERNYNHGKKKESLQPYARRRTACDAGNLG